MGQLNINGLFLHGSVKVPEGKSRKNMTGDLEGFHDLAPFFNGFYFAIRVCQDK